MTVMARIHFNFIQCWCFSIAVGQKRVVLTEFLFRALFVFLESHAVMLRIELMPADGRSPAPSVTATFFTPQSFTFLCWKKRCSRSEWQHLQTNNKNQPSRMHLTVDGNQMNQIWIVHSTAFTLEYDSMLCKVYSNCIFAFTQREETKKKTNEFAPFESTVEEPTTTRCIKL